MKSVIFAVIVGCALLTGCTRQSKPDLRVAILEAEVKELRAQMEEQRTNLLDFIRIVAAHNSEQKSNVLEVQELVIEQQMQNAAIQSMIENLTNKPAPRYLIAAATPVRPATNALSNGVPAKIYNEILTYVEGRYPGNYDMQEFAMREQITAYLKLHPR